MRGRLASRPWIQGFARAALEQYSTDCAPMTSRRRMYASPCRLVLPSRVLPPVEFCRGTRPSQAANSRPLRKAEGSGTVAAMAVATSGPMPGMAARRWLTASALCQARMRASTSAMRSSASWSCAASRWASSCTNPGTEPSCSSPGQQPADVPRSLRLDHAELGEVPADGVDQLGPLADQQVAHAMQHEGRLLRLALHRDEAHRGPGHRLADRRGIGGVVLAPAEVGLDVLGGHQPHLMPQSAQLAGPEMRRGAG